MPYIYEVRLIAFILLFAGTAIGQVSPNVFPLQLGSPNIENVNQEFVLSGKITAKKTCIKRFIITNLTQLALVIFSSTFLIPS